MSLFTDDMILYIENAKDSTKKLLDLLNEYGKIAWYKVNIQKSGAFYTSIINYQNEKFKKQFHLLLQQQQQKKRYLEINLTKEVKDLYSENYRTLKKKIH